MINTYTDINKYYLLHTAMTHIYDVIDNHNSKISLTVIINGIIYRTSDIIDYIDSQGLEYISLLSSDDLYNLIAILTIDELIIIVNNV